MTTFSPSRVSSVSAMFNYVNFSVAGLMMAGGIYFMDATFAGKGFYAMAALMLVSATVQITKTVRDNEEAAKLHNKLEEARTERILAEVSASKPV
jgi:hypothetical protein